MITVGELPLRKGLTPAEEVRALQLSKQHANTRIRFLKDSGELALSRSDTAKATRASAAGLATASATAAKQPALEDSAKQQAAGNKDSKHNKNPRKAKPGTRDERALPRQLKREKTEQKRRYTLEAENRPAKQLHQQQ